MRKAWKVVLPGFSKHSRRKQNSRMSEYIVTHGIRIAKDFVPETFGRLTTIGPVFLMTISQQKSRTSFQVCQCDCGNVVCIRRDYVKNKGTKSCGCSKSASGKYPKRTTLSRGNLYSTWCKMRDRCRNVNHHAYATYGGAGVSVCTAWDNLVDGYTNFAAYMGPRPSPKHSIDRYPNRNGNYEPGNVRWATRTEQNRNRRSCRMLTYNGKTQCLMAWCEEYQLAYTVVCNRLNRGWTVEKALTTPIRAHNITPPENLGLE